MSLPVDPQFPRYLIPQTTIDGPRKTEGDLEITLLCRAVVVPDDQKIMAGEPIQLGVFDFSGPRVERDSGPIPGTLLAACADRVNQLRLQERATLDELPARELARVVLEEIGRRPHPGDNDAVSLAIGVMKLDVEKLTRTGDKLAEMLRMLAPDEPALRREQIEEDLAIWKGQAHRDWSELHALRRST